MDKGFEAGSDSESTVLRYLETRRDDLKDLVMVQYSGMVERIARRFAGIEPYEDLVQVGYIGLLNALTKFDPNAGVRFNTYATYLVAGEMKHYLRDRAQTIRQPAWLQELRHRVTKTAGLLQARHARPATEREIAEELGVSEHSIREVFQTQELLKLTSLDTTPGDEDGESEVERLDSSDYSVDHVSVEDRMVLEQAMGQLRDLERQVLVMFHFDSMNQTEIAAKLEISGNYVSHILRQSLAKLRKILQNEQDQDRHLRSQASEVDHDIVDPLTGAYSEGFFRSRLEEEVHRASSADTSVGVVIVHFSGLETLRKFYGVTSVDDFLVDSAQFLRDSVRRLDLVCRQGETSFGVILPSSGNNVPLIRNRLISKIVDWVNQRYARNSPVRVEIGHASFPECGKSAKILLKAIHMEPILSEEAA